MVLLIAVGVDVWNKSQGRPSIIGYLTRGRSAGATAPAEPRREVPASDTPDASRPLVPAP